LKGTFDGVEQSNGAGSAASAWLALFTLNEEELVTTWRIELWDG
jgi:hypothetical protein